MGALLFLTIGIWTGSAFGPGALERNLTEASLHGHLPLGFAFEAERALTLELRYAADGTRAVYVPADARHPERLVLHAPHYLRGVWLAPVVDMPVDVAETYFHALAEAHLRREAADPHGALGREIRSRARRAMREVPPADRVEAYVDALASFASHALAVANELERKELRRDGSLCPLLRRQPAAPLFTLWEGMFGDGAYAGAYVDRRGEVAFSRSTLAAADKRLVVERVLRTAWTGSAEHDFASRYCPPSGAAAGG